MLTCDEIFVYKIKTYRRLRVLVDKCFYRLYGFWWCHLVGIEPEVGHQFVVVSSFYFHLAQMRCIAFYFGSGSRLAEYHLVGKIWEDDDKYCFVFQRYVIYKPSVGHFYGVEVYCCGVRIVYIELSLVQILEPSLYTEMSALGPTCRKHDCKNGADGERQAGFCSVPVPV